MLHSRSFLSFFAMLSLFTVLAGDAWRYTISWYGWALLALALAATSIALLVAHRTRLRPGSLPYPLVVFAALGLASAIWSAYLLYSVAATLVLCLTTANAVVLAVLLDWRQLLKALSRALKLILALSLLFELFVSVFVRHPVLPLWVDYPQGELPLMLYWSRNVLLDGGPIQGIVGNSSTLAFIALLGVITFGVQLASARSLETRHATHTGGPSRRRAAIDAGIWLAIAFITVALTRSATIVLALVATLLVVGAVLLMRRIPSGTARTAAYAVLAVVAAGATVAGLMLRESILGLLGKSGDLTGRLDIWAAVSELAQQRPVLGWGWISYWAPWLEPFDGLVVRNGVEQMHAHNAWLDVWLQLGWVGVVVLAALALSALVRSWFVALDAEPRDLAVGLLPILLLVALLVQSVAESRLLIEYGWLLFALVAIKTKQLQDVPPTAFSFERGRGTQVTNSR